MREAVHLALLSDIVLNSKNMERLYQKETCLEFMARMNQLNPNSKPQWGKMNVAQMLTHCQKPFEIANGSLVPKPNRIISVLFGKMAKKQLVNDPDFKKNLPTFTEAKITDERVFEIEKSKLIALVERFQSKGKNDLTKNAHPFFGNMSPNDWDILMIKHLNHHLKQFGA